jgi:hypothetical protein
VLTTAAPLLALLAAGVATATTPPVDPKAAKPARPAGAGTAPAPTLIQAMSPPFTEGIFPCSGCHDGKEKVNTARRDLAFHDEQQSVFDHDAEHRWCLDCHDLENRDMLRLASGQLVPFTESYRLCGQCHGDKFRDWRLGVHGKRVGMWNGAKTYLLCVSCHNPHSPAFKGVKQIEVDGKMTIAPTLEKIRPEPRPKRPEEMRP